MRVLVIDDSRTIRLTLAACLRPILGEHLEVVEASDAEEALARLRSGGADLVFLDVMLGGGPDGLAVLRTLREEGTKAPVLIVSGLPADDPRVVEALEQGAAAYLEKPVRSAAVRRAVSRFLVGQN